MKWNIAKMVCLMICVGIFAVVTLGLPMARQSKHSAARITSPDVSLNASEIIGFHLILK